MRCTASVLPRAIIREAALKLAPVGSVAGAITAWPNARAGELVTIRVPTEREARVRDLVRCREAFQREAPEVTPLHPEVPGTAGSGVP